MAPLRPTVIVEFGIQCGIESKARTLDDAGDIDRCFARRRSCAGGVVRNAFGQLRVERKEFEPIIRNVLRGHLVLRCISHDVHFFVI